MKFFVRKSPSQPLSTNIKKFTLEITTQVPLPRQEIYSTIQYEATSHQNKSDTSDKDTDNEQTENLTQSRQTQDVAY